MSSLALNDRPESPLFSDGLGDRVVAADGATADLLQILRLKATLTAVPSFEFALRERTSRLANFRHAYYARVRRVDRSMTPAASLAIVSDHVEGIRLSDILRVAHEKHLQLDINAALCLIRQLVPAVAVLHENARDVAHGAIALERLIVAPNARLVIVEHVLGAAIEQLQFGRERLWQEFRVAMPPSAGLPRFDHRADVTGIGMVALALILGRPIGADEYPHKIQTLVSEARERSALGDEQPLSTAMRGWLSRALQLDVRRAFGSATEAMGALEEIFADDDAYVAAPVALETFLSNYVASLLDPMDTIDHEATPPAERAFAAFDSGAPVESLLAVDLSERRFAPFEAPARPAETATTLAPAEPFGSLDRGLAPLGSEEHDLARGRQDKPFDSRDRVLAQDKPFDSRDRVLAQDKPAPARTPVAATTAAPASTEAPARPSVPAAAAPPARPAVPAAVQAAPAPVQPAVPAPPAVPPVPQTSAPAAPRSPAPAAPQAVKAPSPAPLELNELLGAKAMAEIEASIESRPQPLFNPEQPFTAQPEAPRASRTGGGNRLQMRLAAAVVAVLVLSGGGLYAFKLFGKTTGAPAMGALVVQSNPPGVQVFVDGVGRGVTPARLTVAPGSHILELRGHGVPRVIPLNVTAGAEVSQYLEFADLPGAGQLSVQTDPSGAKVIVDGTERGVAPLMVSELTPGDHEVVLKSDTATARHTVSIQAGGSASLVVPMAVAVSTAPVSGWVSVKAPFTVEIREQGRLLGTTDTDRVMMASGRHELEFVNDTLGYTAKRTIQVAPGKVTAMPLDLPKGVMNLNATPWAEVFIDGQRAGETPIGNLSVPIGPHEIVFRHPQFGEKRKAVSVTLAAPVRVSIDMK
jgi:PEGA domain